MTRGPCSSEERGDIGRVFKTASEWTHTEFELVIADGPLAGSFTGEFTTISRFARGGRVLRRPRWMHRCPSANLDLGALAPQQARGRSDRSLAAGVTGFFSLSGLSLALAHEP